MINIGSKISVGDKFDKLTVVEFSGRDKWGQALWLCICDCGGPNSLKSIPQGNLLRGLTKSCRKCNTFHEHPDGYMVGVTAKGKEFYFDKEDYELVKQYTWHTHNSGYITNKSGSVAIMLHRLLLNVEQGFDVDHINGNRLDNRKINLRVCSRMENLWNSSSHKDSSSRYKGVSYHKDKWEARICSNSVRCYIGRFDTEEEAALAYNKKAKELFGEYAKLNIVEGNECA